MVETLAWPLVASRLELGNPWVMSMGGERGVKLGFDPKSSRLYVRVPADESTERPQTPFAELELDVRNDGMTRVLEVSTRSRRYFREFHRLATLLTENFEVQSQSAMGAFDAAMQGWKDLAASRPILTPEQQLGLLGELLVLEALVRLRGPEAIKLWVGRDSQGSIRHDFRFDKIDLEVKTTRSSARKHIVHGLKQLVPSKEHSLYLISIRLDDGGNSGRSLSSQVSVLRKAITYEAARRQFESLLASASYRDEDDGSYQDRFTLADPPVLVTVDDTCPRLTAGLLSTVSPDLLSRIDRVTYEVNLEGLGVEQGSDAFKTVLGALTVNTQ